MKAINLTAEFGRIADFWSPKIVGELNGHCVRLARVRGEFVWHRHDEEDELFLVVKGSIVIRLRDRDIRLDEGELFIVPRGVEPNRWLTKKRTSFCLSLSHSAGPEILPGQLLLSEHFEVERHTGIGTEYTVGTGNSFDGIRNLARG